MRPELEADPESSDAFDADAVVSSSTAAGIGLTFGVGTGATRTTLRGDISIGVEVVAELHGSGDVALTLCIDRRCEEGIENTRRCLSCCGNDLERSRSAEVPPISMPIDAVDFGILIAERDKEKDDVRATGADLLADDVSDEVDDGAISSSFEFSHLRHTNAKKVSMCFFKKRFECVPPFIVISGVHLRN